MKQFPSEFEAMLSAEGRELLAGRHPAHGVLLRERFHASPEFLDRELCDGAAKLLSELFTGFLVTQQKPLPANNTITEAHTDVLPKGGRFRVVPSTGPMAALAAKLAADIGLLTMLHSESYRAFCEALAGRKLEPNPNVQALAYRHGDYAGPHTDHRPGEPRMINGYTDVHLTFSTPGIRQQWIVYEKDGFLSEQRDIATSGTVTAYRLPVWHYTTPLQADSNEALRWLVLGTFLDA